MKPNKLIMQNRDDYRLQIKFYILTTNKTNICIWYLDVHNIHIEKIPATWSPPAQI